MNIIELEELLLDNLDNGKYDGAMTDNESNGVTWGFYIDKGIPVQYREGKSFKFFDGKENIRTKGREDRKFFDTDEEKLYFFQKYGYLREMFGNHPEVMEYSAYFKGKI